MNRVPLPALRRCPSMHLVIKIKVLDFGDQFGNAKLGERAQFVKFCDILNYSTQTYVTPLRY